MPVINSLKKKSKGKKRNYHFGFSPLSSANAITAITLNTLPRTSVLNNIKPLFTVAQGRKKKRRKKVRQVQTTLNLPSAQVRKKHKGPIRRERNPCSPPAPPLAPQATGTPATPLSTDVIAHWQATPAHHPPTRCAFSPTPVPTGLDPQSIYPSRPAPVQPKPPRTLPSLPAAAGARTRRGPKTNTEHSPERKKSP